ncbi:hypothetical protein LTR10_016819 [Elasticomyces elasticus]|uniref:Nucleotide-diphospho-sugar transferase domain-containing protein n=1 Tax=Exophiala sideris TaxID=1016849 RepID=A0ABR0JPF9_9EURO|nr:hypothetical protein LTR10_016819 [Elasticomyces elasticus]KAK5037822.1 hypothetical protein LTS07_001289 [Exophiala sideris]KAK5043805.1 hypothetical protein LTR13_000159 [Exophiala sideris]KAK5067304.1 hypothetical protein LTR69_001291 [Exophiala sideris]KAK5182637.1 hypothetical protein LTR44_005028 [Eurotiomycetes sp. CCFEE 6388]
MNTRVNPSSVFRGIETFVQFAEQGQLRYKQTFAANRTVGDDEFAHAIRTIFSRTLHDLTSPFRHPLDGSTYKIVEPALWTKPMGKGICIVDIDTRPMDHSGEVWSEDGTFNWQKSRKLTPGFMNHFLYATIHGYDYRYVRTTEFDDRRAPWTKPPALASLIKNYRFVVSIDADVLFPHLTLPYEWLLNHWNVTKDTIVTMTRDVDFSKKPALDKFGRERDNAGFVTLQNHPLTVQLLQEWAECPDKVKGCEWLKNKWPAEQGAWNDYVRYHYLDNVRELPSDEGIGSPKFELKPKGKLVQHYTLNKGQVRGGSQDALAQGFMQSLQAHMVDHKQELVYERLFP